MKNSFKTGFNFWATSWIITTLGLMVWLALGSGSSVLVIGWVLTIAVADSLSDALGIHISEESKNQSHKAVWMSTIATFLTKFIFTMSFIIPVLFFSLRTAVIVSIVWGLLLIFLLSYKVAKDRKDNILHTTLEHIGITILVIILTYFIGIWISKNFS
jgi:VIT1/CCC1 family predicted Fe2+/Mn2+ transporter